LGLALTLAGLVNQTVLLRTDVQPDFEPYASHFVEARGWPFAWLVTEPSAPPRPFTMRERFLAVRFLPCWAGATGVSCVILALLARLRR
jgi:hypothetical protein